MRRRIAVGVLAILSVLLAPARGQEERSFGRVTSIQLADEHRPVGAQLFDLDEDGHDELILIVHREGASEQRDRRVQIHAGRSGDVAFEQSPAHRLALTEDVTALAVGDVHPDPGAEVVLFNARGVFAWRPRAEGTARFVRLCEARFLWQLSSPFDVIDWTAGVRDLDGDGRVDLLIPEPDGYRVALQDRDEDGVSFSRQRFLRVPGGDSDRAGGRLRGRERGRRFQLSLRTGDDDGPWVQVIEGVPAPQALDFDGDGDLDVWALTSRRLCVWRQGENGDFEERPLLSPSPVTIDRSRRFDVSFSSHALDLNGDGRGDCVYLAGDQRSDDLRTQVLVFVQGLGKGRAAQSKDSPLFGERGIPQQLLVIAGIAGSPRFEDVDGDGAPDLVVSSVQPDLLEQMRSRGEGRIEAEIYLYRNRGGLLSKRPDWARTIRVPEEGLRQGRGAITARFVADVTGDRVRDLLLRESADRVELLMLRRRGDELSLIDRPLWTMPIDEEARLDLVDRDGESRLLIFEPDQVHHVRWP